MRILGVDPGLQRTGYACVEVQDGKTALLEGGVVRTNADDSTHSRLRELHLGLVDVCDELKPEVMVIEELFAHYNHPKTAVIMGHARGIVMLVAAAHGMSVESYAATRVKKSITGYGRASKEQVQAAVQSKLQLAKPPEPNDVADAIAIALCHADAQQHGAHLPKALS